MDKLWEGILFVTTILILTCTVITGMIALWRWLGWFSQC